MMFFPLDDGLFFATPRGGGQAVAVLVALAPAPERGRSPADRFEGLLPSPAFPSSALVAGNVHGILGHVRRLAEEGPQRQTRRGPGTTVVMRFHGRGAPQK